MNCWHCDRPAHAACRFCGRGVCRDHAQELPHLEAVFHDGEMSYKALVVAGAVYCGVCKPRGDPVDLPDLK